MRYFIELAYKGTNFHGWQRQPDAISVQEVIETALGTKLQEKVAVVGAGRTDMGVHAEHYIAHFDTEKLFDTGKLCYGLNHLVGKEIVIFRVFEVKPDLHARFDALSRTYEYRITQRKNPFYTDISTLFTQELDIGLMNKAAELLFNYIDFTSFSKLHTDTKTNNCKILEAYWREEKGFLIFKIKADRFLRNMVRAIVGTSLEVGLKKISLKEFEKIIEAKNRSKAGMSVPAEGLFLTKVEY